MSLVPVKILAGLIVIGILGGCAGTPQDVIGVDGQAFSATDVPDITKHRIVVASTRALSSDNPARMFTGARSTDLHFATVDMFVPPSHETGQIERADRLPPDPRTDMVALNPRMLEGKSGFVGQIERELRERPPADRNVLVFVHGYNTSFDAALFRFTQFVHDTGYQGVPILFTWPSGGRVTDYVYDINSVLGSRDSLLETFRLIARTPARRGDIVAHSMGNFLTVETLRQAAISGVFGNGERLRYVIMASPDIDIDVFETQVRSMPQGLHKFYVLLSEDDRPLAISRRIAGRVDRVGNSPEIDRLEGLGINVVDLSQVEVEGSLHHSKFADAPAIVQMIGKRLQDGEDQLSTAGGQSVTVRLVQGVVSTATGVVNTATAIPRSILPTDQRVFVD